MLRGRCVAGVPPSGDRRGGEPVKIVVGQRRARRRTARVYDQQTVVALSKLWRHFGYLCGKRLAATLRLWLRHYEGWDARSKSMIVRSPEVRAKLLRISPATIDRLLPRRPPRRETQADVARQQSHQETERVAHAADPDPHWSCPGLVDR